MNLTAHPSGALDSQEENTMAHAPWSQDKEILIRWIREEKASSPYTPDSRSGYLTNLSSPDIQKNPYFFSGGPYNTITLEENGEDISVALETIKDSEWQAGVRFFTTAFHNHEFFEMIYVFRGRCLTTIEEMEVPLTQGNLCIYNLKTIHSLKIEDPDSAVFNILISKELFDRTFLQLIHANSPVSGFFIRSLYNIPGPSGHLVFSLTAQSPERFYLEKILAEFYQKSPLYHNLMYSNLVCLFILLSRSYQKQLTAETTGTKKIDVVQLLSYLSVHYRTVTLKQLARHFGYSSRTMIRLIHSYTYRTFRDIVTEFRMEEARNLLKDPSLSIEEIAMQTGYQDRSYFDKVFKRTFHLTPAQYRKLL